MRAQRITLRHNGEIGISNTVLYGSDGLAPAAHEGHLGDITGHTEATA